MNIIFKRSIARCIRRPISKQFFDYLSENFGFNGRFKESYLFLSHFKILSKRRIQKNGWTVIEDFEVRIGRPRRIYRYFSNAQISIRFNIKNEIN